MRSFHLLAALVSAVGVAADDSVDEYSAFNILSLAKRDDCSASGYATCGSKCMPIGANCCNPRSSFCLSGYSCLAAGGCCPVGKTCSGSAGTVPYYLSRTIDGGAAVPAATSTYVYRSSSAGGSSYSYSYSSRSSPVGGSGASVSSAVMPGVVATPTVIQGGSSAGAAATGPVAAGPVPANGDNVLTIGAGPAWVAGAMAAGMALL